MDPHENYGGINQQKNPCFFFFFQTGKHYPQEGKKKHTVIASLCDLINIILLSQNIETYPALSLYYSKNTVIYIYIYIHNTNIKDENIY